MRKQEYLTLRMRLHHLIVMLPDLPDLPDLREIEDRQDQRDHPEHPERPERLLVRYQKPVTMQILVSGQRYLLLVYLV
jgi:hypothetical protein